MTEGADYCVQYRSKKAIMTMADSSNCCFDLYFSYSAAIVRFFFLLSCRMLKSSLTGISVMTPRANGTKNKQTNKKNRGQILLFGRVHLCRFLSPLINQT